MFAVLAGAVSSLTFMGVWGVLVIQCSSKGAFRVIESLWLQFYLLSDSPKHRVRELQPYHTQKINRPGHEISQHQGP